MCSLYKLMLLQLFNFPTWSVSVEIPVLFGKLNHLPFYTLLVSVTIVNPDFLPNNNVKELGLSRWQNLFKGLEAIWREYSVKERKQPFIGNLCNSYVLSVHQDEINRLVIIQVNTCCVLNTWQILLRWFGSNFSIWNFVSFQSAIQPVFKASSTDTSFAFSTSTNNDLNFYGSLYYS